MFFSALNLRLLCILSCLVITMLFAQNAKTDQRQPAVPGEYYSDIFMFSNGLVMSADGRWASFISTGGLGLVDLHSGEIKGLGNRNEFWSLMMMDLPTSSWSPVAPQLAFNLSREGKPFFSVWSPGDEKPRDLLGVPRDMESSFTVPPVWSADGKTVYVLLNKDLPWRKSHPDDDYPPTRNENVRLHVTEHYGESTRRRRFEQEYEGAYAESKRSLIMAIDVATGRAGVLVRGNDIAGMYLSPDNKHLIAVQPKTTMPDKELTWTKQVYMDMYLLDIVPVSDLPAIDLEEQVDRRAGWFDHREQRLTPILTDIHLNRPDRMFNTDNNFFGTNGNPVLSWSPDSRQFTYATVGRQSRGDVFVYDIASARLRNLTERVELAESPKALGYGEKYTWQFNSLKFGNLYPPLWLPDGKSLLAVGSGDVWQVFLNPDRKPRLLTGDVPQEVRRIIPSYGWNTAALDANGRLTLVAKERESRLDSLWKLDVNKGRSTKLADTEVWVNMIALTDVKGERLLYVGQAPTSPRNIYQVAGNGTPELVTKFQLQLMERRYPIPQVLTWQAEDGEEARGLLYLPEGASKSQKVPMVVNGYPGRIDSREDDRAKRGLQSFDDALYGLLQEGFAVLYPDIELSNEGVYERPMFQVVDAVISATDAALATGVIDADRLGIMGGSYGGYMTQAVIAQTDRFKTAVSMYGLADLYGGYSGGGDVSLPWSEIGQGRLGVAPWVDAKRYTDNSPLSYFDKIKTPLLLIHGEGDGRVPIEMSRQSFRALEHLENPTVFARYRRLGHNTTQEVNQRVKLWFRQHLLDGDAVAGLADQGSFFLGGDLAQDKLITE